MKRTGLLICLLLVGSASMWAADLCADATTCSLTFTQGNSSSGFGTGNFGTLDLTLNSGTSITGTITLAHGWYLVETGFPGAFGFVSSVAFSPSTSTLSAAAYTGFTYDSTAPNSLHFDGFGYANGAGATSAPSPGGANKVGTLTFTLMGNYTDVEQILGAFNPAGGDGPANFVADVFHPDCGIAGNTSCTGLIAINGPGSPIPPPPPSVPEPASMVMLGTGLLGIAGTIRRRISK